MKRRQFLKTLAAGAVFAQSRCPVKGAESPLKLPTPRPAQWAWQEAEVGALFHYDLSVFDGKRYNQHRNQRTPIPDPNIFNPQKLDTDQWIAAAKAMGARFAILTATHETGFCNWQSDANPYCLKAVRWGGGKRDLVKEFVASCRRASLKPGLYLSAHWNAHLGVLNFHVTKRSPITQAQYNHLIEQEVRELCSRYGPLFELWFDGGILTPEEGGPDVLPIFERYQPHCLFYSSDQRRDARWGGTESGTVGYPCWATINLDQIRTSTSKRELLRHGDPTGKDWCPAMSDAPLRGAAGLHEWVWNPGDERGIYPVEELTTMYERSVGRNSTLILGLTPGPDGLLPQPDAKRCREFGDAIRRQFGTPIAQGSGPTLTLDTPKRIGHAVIQEEIHHGERVREYTLEARTPAGPWQPVAQGTCIGHKRIETFTPVETAALRLVIHKTVAPPRIRTLSAFA